MCVTVSFLQPNMELHATQILTINTMELNLHQSPVFPRESPPVMSLTVEFTSLNQGLTNGEEGSGHAHYMTWQNSKPVSRQGMLNLYSVHCVCQVMHIETSIICMGCAWTLVAISLITLVLNFAEHVRCTPSSLL